MTIDLYVDIVNMKLVQAFDDSTVFTKPFLTQGDTYTVNVYPVRPSESSVNGPFTYATDVLDDQGSPAVDRDAWLTLCGGDGNPDEAEPGTTPIASASGVRISNGWTFQLSLDTAECITFLSTTSPRESTLEFKSQAPTTGALKLTHCQEKFWIHAHGRSPGSSAPSLAAAFYETGITNIAAGVLDVAVSFVTTKSSASLRFLELHLQNADADPDIISVSHIKGTPTTAGFTARLTAPTTSSNYKLHWTVEVKT